MELTDVQYKESEIGVIPVDWEVKKLIEISDLATGNTPPTNDQSNYGDEFLFVSPADLGKGKWITQTEKKLSKKGFSISRKFPKNSILFTCIGSTIGKSGMAQLELTSNQQINAVIPSSKYANEFIFYALDYISPRIKLLAGEQAVPIVNKTLFGETLLAVPPTKSEQTAIATALSDTDALIENLEKLIAKKRNIKQGVMQELLTGRKRLRGFSNEWKLKQVGKIADVGRGRVISHREIDKALESKYPVYSSQTSNDGIMGYLDTYDFDGEYITWTTDGVNAGKVFHRLGKFNCTNVCGTIRLKNDYAPFVALILDRTTPRHVSINLANPKLMNDPMKKIEILLPAFEEQKAIAEILSELGNEIKALQHKLNKYRMIKQGMMQSLLTGKIRLV